MPTYLRNFYFKKLLEAKKNEQEQYDKAKKGGGSTPGQIKRPSFSKPSRKSPKS